MPTLGDLVDEVISNLHGHVDMPAMGTLTTSISPTDTTVVIDFGNQPGAARPNGVIEIGSELLMVTRFDATTNTATVAPWGRGHMHSAAVAHSAGERVTVRPRYPRKRVADVIREVVRASCPPLFVARDLDPIDVGGVLGLGFPLPDDTLRVLRVDATRQGSALQWFDRIVLPRWTVRTVAGQKLLQLRDCPPFVDLQITVAAEPGELVAETDDFATVTGLTDSVADVIVLGAISRLVLSVELARQQVISPEAMGRADKVPVQSGMAVSRYYTALYQQRLAAEQDRLSQEYPIQLLRRG